LRRWWRGQGITEAEEGRHRGMNPVREMRVIPVVLVDDRRHCRIQGGSLQGS